MHVSKGHPIPLTHSPLPIFFISSPLLSWTLLNLVHLFVLNFRGPILLYFSPFITKKRAQAHTYHKNPFFLPFSHQKKTILSSFLAFFYYGRNFLLSLAWSSRQRRYYGCDKCHTCMPCLTPLLTYKRIPSPPHFLSILGPLACVCYCNSPMHWCWLAHASN